MAAKVPASPDLPAGSPSSGMLHPVFERSAAMPGLTDAIPYEYEALMHASKPT